MLKSLNSIFIWRRKNRIKLTFLIIFCMGLFFSKDYGISWDERYHREDGRLTLVYVLQLLGIHNLIDLPLDVPEPNKIGYSALFDMSSLVIEKLFFISDVRSAYLIRHALNFTFYFIGIYFFYLFVKEIFKKNSISFFITMFYLLHPRLLAHGFFNCKDSIAQALIASSLLPIYLTFKKGNLRMTVLAGILTALGVVTRLPTIYFPLLFIALIFFKSINAATKSFSFQKSFKIVFVFFMMFGFSIYLFQPAFWGATINDLKSIIKLFVNHPWDGYNYYFGRFISALDVPWHYIPAWILISTPVSFIIYLFIGSVKILSDLSKTINQKTLFNFFIFICFVAPVFVIIILGSTLYDGWRHVFFLYPFLSYTMGIGFLYSFQLIKKKYSLPDKKILIILGALTFCEPIFKIVAMHPHQQVYFNIFAGKIPTKKFEGDYWGLSMRQGLEWILKNDKRKVITVASDFNLARFNRVIIKTEERDRILFLDDENSDFMKSKGVKKTDPIIFGDQKTYPIDYFLTNYRRKESKDVILKNKKYFPYINEVHSIKVDNMKILGVYKFSNDLY